MTSLPKFSRNTKYAVTGIAAMFVTTILSANEVVPIFDPQKLESMGLEPDSANVYEPFNLNFDSGANLKANFGTGSNYTTIDAKTFNGREGDWDYRNGGNGINRISATEQFADAQLNVPHGAKLTEVRWWGSDSVAQDIGLLFFTYCLPDTGASAYVITTLINETSNTAGGLFTQSYPLDHTVDNQSCIHRVRVRFTVTNNTQYLQKITFKWERQIGPGPATASFFDVPTTHPFYDAVEAMGGSGITGGCGGGNYCPNDPLTRGQMAAFLARALGISWETIPDPSNP